ncbi:hypothetical protein [Acidovorax sp. SUPP3334]|uniref:hypothetical protein n=1 Tax=Acidovorax sp. SUPP3334 TaxID=2920881 RepID=UPI0023DE4F2B|nr:hypothetical protein [Acidovorax sp. SUPP3334]GKT24590.1 hypothetical protein AVHM3334_15245 [Acidovorax sp. SUPP3334]
MNRPGIKNLSNNAGHFKLSKTTNTVLGAIALCVLSACGGGGGSDSGIAATPGGATPTTPAPGDIAPVTPAPAPSTVASDCGEDGNVLTVAGNTAQIDGNVYHSDGTTVISTQQRKFATSNGASFRDKTGLFLVNQVNTTTYSNAAVNGSFGGSVMTTTANNYSSVVGDARQTYGLTVSNLFQGTTTTASSYFTPYAYTGAPLNPALGTAYTASYSTTTESGGTTQPALAQSSITTYSAESVSVLAGTFPACKIKVEVTGGATIANVSYAWLVASGRYKGLVVRTANASGVKTSEATRLLVNGQ